MLSRFAGTRTSPWSASHVSRRGAFRIMQFNWADPAFGSGNTWEATRRQLIAEVLLSNCEVVALQGLEREQVLWLKDAFDVQGYEGIIGGHVADDRALDGGTVLPGGGRELPVATFWRKTTHNLHSIQLVGDGTQGAQVVTLNASHVRLVIANIQLDISSPPSAQLSILDGVVQRSNSQDESVIAALGTLPPDSPALQHLRSYLDSTSDVISGRVDFDFYMGIHSGSMWYQPGILQVIGALVPPDSPIEEARTNGWAAGGCVPTLVEFVQNMDSSRRHRSDRVRNPLGDVLSSSLVGSESAGLERKSNAKHNSSAAFLRELASVKGVCLNIDELFVSSTKELPSLADEHDGLRHMFRCVSAQVDGGSQAQRADMSVQMGRSTTVAERLDALTKYLVAHKVSRQQVRTCFKSWTPPRCPGLSTLVKTLHEQGRRVMLRSDGLFELARQVGGQVGVPDPHVTGHSLTFSGGGLVTGVVSFSQGIYSYEANSEAAAMAKVSEHKVALRNAKYAVIGGTEADLAARSAAPPGSRADVLITIGPNRTTAPGHPRGVSTESSPGKRADADWNARDIGELVFTCFFVFQLPACEWREGARSHFSCFSLEGKNTSSFSRSLREKPHVRLGCFH